MFCHVSVSVPPGATVAGLATSVGGWTEIVLLTATRLYVLLAKYLALYGPVGAYDGSVSV